MDILFGILHVVGIIVVVLIVLAMLVSTAFTLYVIYHYLRNVKIANEIMREEMKIRQAEIDISDFDRHVATTPGIIDNTND